MRALPWNNKYTVTYKYHETARNYREHRVLIMMTRCAFSFALACAVASKFFALYVSIVLRDADDESALFSVYANAAHTHVREYGRTLALRGGNLSVRQKNPRVEATRHKRRVEWSGAECSAAPATRQRQRRIWQNTLAVCIDKGGDVGRR